MTRRPSFCPVAHARSWTVCRACVIALLEDLRDREATATTTVSVALRVLRAEKAALDKKMAASTLPKERG